MQTLTRVDSPRLRSLSPAGVVLDLAPGPGSFREDALFGLQRPRKSVPPKYLYDARGSELFERICALDEYYPTRTELSILERHGEEIARRIGGRSALIEFGSGASRKTRILLDHLQPASELAGYVPVDISRSMLALASESLARDYPGLRVLPVCGDYTAPLGLARALPQGAERLVAFFPGSTIGNLEPARARRFLTQVAELLGPGGALLVGVDLVKDRATLEAAYNDSRGLTAEFNLNLLARMNRELEADFDLSAFEHQAFFNEAESRIEMHLRSRAAQRARVASREIRFAEGETLHTENSYKYSPAGFAELAGECGFEVSRSWTDERGWFAVFLLEVGLEIRLGLASEARPSAIAVA